ncbi:cystathionine beta-synthase [Egicoccus halophilus]|uniref:Cystathionine beta-synthase n=1 Tax=Egicoccus halophilus TaxID=1670830 RepID=A0A8J3A7M7_9ACTN|nr:cystathionine beta-synthase [Egicoccus halophilus]GGI03958.1 cystathionine beta-synthase [Egicoccus halophilus]
MSAPLDVSDRSLYSRTVGIDHDPLAGPRRHVDERGREVAPDLLALMGDTPLVRLDRLSKDVGPTLLAKLEMLNPGGSVKDRIGIAMIEAAEAAGVLHPGGTIVEPTSGNTGVGLAIASARKGYRCVFVVPDKVSTDKISLMRAYGAEVVVCPTSVEPDDPRSYYSVSDRLAAQPNAFKPNQYFNQANPQTHVFSTGPELWRQTNGLIDAFVCGVGTGGTATGVGRYLKDRNASVQIVGADPEGSLYSGDEVHTYLVEGIGEDFWPQTFDPAIVDHWYRVSDRDSFLTARRCAREEGILVGGSCGTALWAGLEYARDQPEDATIVVLLPDSGRGYLSKFYDERWLAEHGFVEHASGAGTVGDVLHAKGAELPPLVHLHPGEQVSQAISLLKEYGVSQMPVFREGVHDDATADDILGSVRENALLDAALRDPEAMSKPVIEVMQPPLATAATDDALDHVLAGLATGAPAVVVHDAGRAVGVLTRADLLTFLATR